MIEVSEHAIAMLLTVLEQAYGFSAAEDIKDGYRQGKPATKESSLSRRLKEQLTIFEAYLPLEDEDVPEE